MGTVFGALDVSSVATGFAFTDGEFWESGYLRSPIKKSVLAGALDAVYTGEMTSWFDETLWNLFGQYKPKRVAIEQPLPGNMTRTRMVVDMHAGFAGQAMKREQVGGTNVSTLHLSHAMTAVAARICVRRGAIPEFVSQHTWRATVGIGRAPKHVKAGQTSAWYKREAITMCRRHGIEVSSHDQAEAVCMLIHLRSKMGVGDDLFARA